VSSIFSIFFLKNKRYGGQIKSIKYYSFTSLDLVKKYDKKTQKFKNLFPLIYNYKNLEQAWLEIKNNSINLTNMTILKLNWFKEVSKKLESSTYSYRMSRKVFIPKSEISNSRTLTIISPQDKVVQRAFLRVLQPIYEGVVTWNTVSHKEYEEYQKFYKIIGRNSRKICDIKGKKTYQIKKWTIKPLFHEDSFGFRPNRSPHLALKKIKETWNPLIWFWSVELIKIFKNINQHKLINEIEKTIDDQKLINELWKMFKAKTISFSNDRESTKNIFQDGILSPFLFNIFMTPLDYYIKQLQADCEKINFSSNNLENSKDSSHTKLLGIRTPKKELDKISKLELANKFKDVYYARYGDSFILGLNTNKQIARFLTIKIRDFIKSDLHLNFYDSGLNAKLIHGRSEYVLFLGFQIGCYFFKSNIKSNRVVRFKKLKANIKRKRVIESEIYLKLVERICAKHYRQVVDSIRVYGQTLVKRFQIKKINNHRVKVKVINALKNSLLDLESELLGIKPYFSNFGKDSIKPNSPLAIAEQKRLNLLKFMTQKWIQKATDIANKEDEMEIKNLVGEYLSPRFTKAREIYLRELEKISSINFNEEIIEKKLKKVEVYKDQSFNVKKMLFRSRIRILFPVKEIKEKLRSLGFIHKVITRPIGINYLTSQKDYDIINWYSFKANSIWNYYCCVDNICELKKMLNWIVRYSLLGTLASKYKSSIKLIIQKYTLAPKISYIYQKKSKECINSIAFYPSKEYFNKKKKDFNKNSLSPIELKDILKSRINFSYYNLAIERKCGIINCKNRAEETYYFKKSTNHTINNFSSFRFNNWKVNESVLKNKQVFLCKSCYYKAYENNFLSENFDSKFSTRIEK
jgi:retron-type reverse transcriptase